MFLRHCGRLLKIGQFGSCLVRGLSTCMCEKVIFYLERGGGGWTRLGYEVDNNAR